MTQQGTPRMLTVQDLADRCQVSKKTVYRWNTEGTGPRRIGVGRVRYRLSDVEQWERDREIDMVA